MKKGNRILESVEEIMLRNEKRKKSWKILYYCQAAFLHETVGNEENNLYERVMLQHRKKRRSHRERRLNVKETVNARI